ncbi:MAG: hypothetical protein IJY25_04490 [Bacilli bacterium]|nr:hypothetical protein [Bacilli bacterium]
MNNDSLERKLEQLRIEDFIWVIYIGIIFISWYANNLERKYFIYNDLESREQYRKIMIFIFSILIIIYLYFVKDSYDDVKNINPYESQEVKDLTLLSYIGSLLIFISGVIFLYIAIKDEELNVELAFN